MYRDLQKYYSETAPHFDEVRLDRDEEVMSTAAAFAQVLTLAGPLLEIGCGTGRHSVAIAALGRTMLGLDRSIAQLVNAPSSLLGMAGDGCKLPVRTGVMAGCACILVLHQLAEPDRLEAIRECFRVLQPGGALFIKTCSHEDLARRPFADFFPSALAINLARYPPIELLVGELQRSGFDNVRVGATYSEESIAPAALLKSVALRHNSTLPLIR